MFLLFSMLTCGLGCLCIPCCLDEFDNLYGIDTNATATATSTSTANNIAKSAITKAGEVAYENHKKNK